MAATYVAFYTIGAVETKAYQQIYEGIYRTVLVSATAFLTFPIWPSTIKSHRFMAFFWPLGICTILFCAGTLLVILGHFHHIQIMIQMLNLLMAVLLLRWPLAFFLALIGAYAAVGYFTYCTGTMPPVRMLGSIQMIYGLLFFSV
jgi:hypothetical protein